VLKPGGTFINSDMFWAAPDIRGRVEEAGFEDVTSYFPHIYHFPPAFIVSGKKPKAKIGNPRRSWKSHALWLVVLFSCILYCQ
jgi:hypothetical protein